LALPPTTNEAFVREVDEEVRRDRMASIWTRYGRWIVVGFLAALAAFAGYLFWRNYQQTVAGEEGEKLQTAYDALAASNPTAAAKPLAELATSRSDGNRALAKFTQADVLLQRDDFKGAAAKFAEISRDDDLAPAFRDLALIRQTVAEYDTLAPQAVIGRLGPVAVPGNAYFGSAGELVAAAHLRAGRRDQAGRLFGQIARDANVPATLRQRAVQMAGLLGVDAVVQNEEAKTR
jgi:hypothetical protein